MKRLRWLAVVFVFALLAAACSSTSDDTTTTTAQPDTGDTTTTAPPDTGDTTTTTTEAPMEFTTDIGVDLEAGTIKIGLLADLSGVFSGLVTPIVTAEEAYWAKVNAEGGIHGLQVELVVRDTGYLTPNHVQHYAELKTEVVAIAQSTGSPQTVAIQEDLVDDEIYATPLTWYSGWTDPNYNSNLLHHGVPYCVEAMNVISWVRDELIAEGASEPTIAIASVPGDYGLDSAAGAALAAEALGMEVVFDATGLVGRPEDAKAIADQIVAADPDMVWITATPGTFPPVYQEAIASGFVAAWAGAAPTYALTYLTGDFATEIERDWYMNLYFQPWGGESEGAVLVRELMEGAPPFDYYAEGVVEGIMMRTILNAAYESGDLTQAGVLAAAKSLEGMDLLGLGPAESYVGSPNDQIQRSSILVRPSLADLAAGGSGSVIIDPDFTSDIAEAFVFEEACFQL